jgi:tRNA nucleotidyltransferase (CCA-adding enzyme)
MATYLVGGAVRDALLGQEPVERDWVVVGVSAEELEAAGYRPVGRDFPVFLHPKTREEYALARTERKRGHGYHGFTVQASPTVTLEADLGRRDLTINAIAQDAAGDIIDPYSGRDDLAARVLRHVSPAFVEDPLRVLRVARFAARLAPLGFTVAVETRALMATMSFEGELAWLAPERVWQETQRALGEPAPERFFIELAESHALEPVLPELAPLFVEPTVHPGSAALAGAVAAGAEAPVRYAALLHRFDPDGEPAALAERLPVPRRWAELATLAARWHEACFELDPADGAAAWGILQGLDALRRSERFDAFLAVCDAIARARGDDRWPARAEALRTARAAAMGVDGGALARAGWRGHALGTELARRRAAAIERALGAP